MHDGIYNTSFNKSKRDIEKSRKGRRLVRNFLSLSLSLSHSVCCLSDAYFPFAKSFRVCIYICIYIYIYVCIHWTKRADATTVAIILVSTGSCASVFSLSLNLVLLSGWAKERERERESRDGKCFYWDPRGSGHLHRTTVNFMLIVCSRFDIYREYMR